MSKYFLGETVAITDCVYQYQILLVCLVVLLHKRFVSVPAPCFGSAGRQLPY